VITVEGYQAFHGTMRITPIEPFSPFELSGDWLYKPEYDCWYCKGHSFPAEICEIAEDEP
jgi:hypothetical protein